MIAGAEVVAVRVGGVRLTGHASGSGRPLVLVHGLGGSSRHLLPTMRRLDSERCIALDLPGFGGSGIASLPFSLDRSSDVLARAIIELGLARPIVVGHSFGAAAALRLAARHPALASALVLVGPTGLVATPPATRRRLTRATAIHARVVRSPIRLEGLVARSRQARRLLLRELVSDPAAISPETFRMLLEESAKARQLPSAAVAAIGDLVDGDAERCAVPVGAIWGSHDLISGAAERARLSATVPRATITRLPGLGHVPQLEDPVRFADALRELVARLAVPIGYAHPDG